MSVAILTLLGFLMLFSSACADETDLGYLPMPEKYLGYWGPYSRGTANVGLDVTPEEILWKDDGTDFVKYIHRYKVFHIDDEYAYAIIEEYTTPQWVEQLVEMVPNATKDEWYAGPVYTYERYNIRADRPHPLLIVKTSYCKLTEEDWNLPASIHWQRVEEEYCKSIEGDSGGFYQSSTWAK